MSLSRRERRALRNIERGLRSEDPALVRHFTTRPDPVGSRMVSGLAAAFVVVVLALLLGGLVLTDRGMLTGGFLVLVMMAPTVWLVAAARRRPA